MQSEPRWLPREAVIDFNADEVAKTGEPFSLRDEGLLESALARPRNHWAYGEGDIVTLAVTLLFGIARNHPFEQGNKRTAFIAAAEFLNLNGYDLMPEANTKEFADMLVSAIEKRISDEELTARFTELVQPTP